MDEPHSVMDCDLWHGLLQELLSHLSQFLSVKFLQFLSVKHHHAFTLLSFSLTKSSSRHFFLPCSDIFLGWYRILNGYEFKGLRLEKDSSTRQSILHNVRLKAGSEAVKVLHVVFVTYRSFTPIDLFPKVRIKVNIGSFDIWIHVLH